MIKGYKIVLIIIIVITSLYYFEQWRSNNIVDYDNTPSYSINKTQDSIQTEWKKIYYDLATEEDKILYAADKKFKPSEFEEYGDYTNNEIAKLRDAIKGKYNIPDSIFNKIVYEGAKNKWPFKSSF